MKWISSSPCLTCSWSIGDVSAVGSGAGLDMLQGAGTD